MSGTPQTEERPGYPRQEIHQAAQESVTHLGEPMMSKHTTTAHPSADELCKIMSDLAGLEIETVGDMFRFSDQVGIEPSDFLKTAETIATIEAALRAGGKR